MAAHPFVPFVFFVVNPSEVANHEKYEPTSMTLIISPLTESSSLSPFVSFRAFRG